MVPSELRRPLAIGFLLFALPACAGDLLVTNNTELNSALTSAQAGDRILLAPGTYGRFSHSGLSGVTIRSQDASNRAVIDAGGSGEVMKLSSITDVTIEHLVFQNFASNGINIDDSGNWPTGRSSGVVIRDVVVRNNTAVSGNRDGIKLSGVDNFLIDRVEVINWSSGGSAIDPVGSHNGVIRNSRFIHDGATASGIRPKGGSSGIDIFGNYVRMSGGRAIQFGGSTGSEFFRFLPGESDYEADNIRAAGNIVRGGESAFSWVNIDGGEARYNLVDTPERWVIRILNENQGNSIVDTQNGVFYDNVVYYDDGLSRLINIGPEVLSETFTYERNRFIGPNDFPSINDPDPESAVVWETDWGVWVVNPHLSEELLTFGNFEQLERGTMNEGASFDPLAADPFQGDWSFAPLTDSSLLVGAQEQLFLRAVAVPEPSSFALAMLFAFGWLNRRGRDE